MDLNKCGAMGHSVIQLNWLSVSFLKERKKERMSERTGSGSGSDRTKRSNTSGVEPHESRRRKEENLIGVRRQKRARLRYPVPIFSSLSFYFIFFLHV